MHGKKGEVLHVKDVPENLGFNHFMGETLTHDYSDRTSQSFLVPFKEIKENDWDLSINSYKEIVYKEVIYDAPKIIIERIAETEKERSKLMSNLKSNL
jgi:type I restriction enzyme M protein